MQETGRRLELLKLWNGIEITARRKGIGEKNLVARALAGLAGPLRQRVGRTRARAARVGGHWIIGSLKQPGASWSSSETRRAGRSVSECSGRGMMLGLWVAAAVLVLQMLQGSDAYFSRMQQERASNGPLCGKVRTMKGRS